jgi:Asp-tRNA(Asn)/Glu-tRNA(Gln) amidotransferase A subunit family amidase
MAARPLIRLAGAEIAAGIAAGTLSAEQVARAHLERIAEREPLIGAWTYIEPERVIERARAFDRAPIRGPLQGVPVAVKDIIATSDMPTEYGSPIYRGHRPAWDAACVTALREAGAIIFGKTVTTEFATSHPGKTVNPHDPTRTPGGSSSGSAAAVADFMVPLALGTQTGGSVIRPASFCGVVGYKPSFGVINRHGVKPLSESLDTVGVMARTVEDVALLVGAITGRGAWSKLPEVESPRIGVWRTHAWAAAAPETVAALEATIRALEAAGAKIEDAQSEAVFAQADAAHHDIEHFELARSLAFERREHPALLSAVLTRRIAEGWQCSPERYDEMVAVAAASRQVLAQVFSRYDVLLSASATGEASKGLASTGSAVFNRIWTLFHVPTVTIPAARGPNGLPVGVQIIGPAGGDLKALAVSAWAMRALGLEVEQPMLEKKR